MKIKKLYSFVIAISVVLAGLAILSETQLPKEYRLLAVTSGSMEPALKIGSVVVIKKTDKYQVGDIITYPKGNTTVTHRITALDQADGNTNFTTKGDANNTVDLDKVPEVEVIGKVMSYVPLVGYVTTFVKTQTGFLILIVIPSTIIIWTELMNIKEQSKRLIRERKKRKLNPLEKIEVAIGEEETKIENKLNGE